MPEDGDHIAAIPGRQAQRLSPGGLKLEQVLLLHSSMIAPYAFCICANGFWPPHATCSDGGCEFGLQLPVMRTGGLDTTAPLDVVRSSIGRQSPSGNNERGTESLPGRPTISVPLSVLSKLFCKLPLQMHLATQISK